MLKINARKMRKKLQIEAKNSGNNELLTIFYRCSFSAKVSDYYFKLKHSKEQIMKQYLRAISIFTFLLTSGAVFAETIIVDTTKDKFSDSKTAQYNCLLGELSPDCSLREAVQTANDLPGDDTIILGEGTYKLTLHGMDEEYNKTGDLDIKDTLTITGIAAEKTFIDGDLADRIFHHHKGNLTLNKLTLINGIIVYSKTLNTFGTGGAAILSNLVGKLSINQVIVRNNTTEFTDEIYCQIEGIPFEPSIGEGNTIFYHGNDLSLTGSAIINNQFTCLGEPANHFIFGKGYALFAKTDKLRLENVLIANNVTEESAENRHATVLLDCYGQSTCQHTIDKVTMSHNGELNIMFDFNFEELNDVSININELKSSMGRVLIDAINFSENGEHNIDLVIKNSSFENSELYGLQYQSYERYDDSEQKSLIIVNASIEHSTFAKNGIGVKLFKNIEDQNFWLLRNNTISGNTQGGIDVGGFNALDLTYNTIAFNGDPSKDIDGVNIFYGSSVTNVNLLGNIISNPQGGKSCAGHTYQMYSQTYNLDSDGSCLFYHPAEGDIIGFDPLLKSLAHNGGKTKTHALKIGSPAIDAAKVTEKDTGTVFDQRYVSRTGNGVGNNPDIGSFELFTPPSLSCDIITCGGPEN